MAQEAYWKCTCGRMSGYVTSETKAQQQADEHETYCAGETQVVAYA